MRNLAAAVSVAYVGADVCRRQHPESIFQQSANTTVLCAVKSTGPQRAVDRVAITSWGDRFLSTPLGQWCLARRPHTHRRHDSHYIKQTNSVMPSRIFLSLPYPGSASTGAIADPSIHGHAHRFPGNFRFGLKTDFQRYARGLPHRWVLALRARAARSEALLRECLRRSREREPPHGAKTDGFGAGCPDTGAPPSAPHSPDSSTIDLRRHKASRVVCAVRNKL
jgi:hypothetical protein